MWVSWLSCAASQRWTASRPVWGAPSRLSTTTASSAKSGSTRSTRPEFQASWKAWIACTAAGGSLCALTPRVPAIGVTRAAHSATITAATRDRRIAPMLPPPRPARPVTVPRPMIFDTHVHLWSADRARYPMVAGRERPIEHDGSAETLIGLMDAAGVQAALLVQTPWLGEDNRYLVDSMRRFPGRFAALGWLEDPLAPDAPNRLRKQHDEDRFRGVRLHLTEARINDGVLAGAADPLFAEAHRLGVPVQFLNRVPTHPTILGVARRFPDLTIVVDHLGHPVAEEAPGFVSSVPFFELADLPNVHVKVSNHVISS